MVIQIVLVKIVRVFYNTVRIEYKNTFTGSYPYPSVTVFADSADFLLALSLIEKMPEYVFVFFRNSEIKSSAERSYPHTLFAVLQNAEYWIGS